MSQHQIADVDVAERFGFKHAGVRGHNHAALVVAGRAETLRDGADLASEAIDSGAPRRVLEKLVAATNGSEVGD